MASRILTVVPARYGSTRLKGKPILQMAGYPMLVYSLQGLWCACDVCMSDRFYDLVVATDDTKVKKVIEQWRPDVEVVLTSPDLESGTDRVAVVAKDRPGYDIVVNAQGDMPFLRPRTWIEPLIKALEENPALDMVTPVSSMPYVTGTFSRSHHWQHVGVYAYRPAALQKFYEARNDHKVRKREKQERLEQLRAVDMGLNVHALHINQPAPVEVNTMDDWEVANFIACNCCQVHDDFYEMGQDDEFRNSMSEDDDDDVPASDTVH